MRAVAAHQPNYLPNLGFFYKLARADIFVIITNLQFEKQEGWQQRHKIAGPSGDIWLTVPVRGSQNQLIKEVKIENSTPWRRKHKRTIELTYARSPGRDHLPWLTQTYETAWERLVDLNVELITRLKEILGISTPIVLDEEVSGAKEELLINVCKKYGADTYLSGIGAKDYLTPERLMKIETAGITHLFVEKNLTAEYPYAAIHYILSEGVEATRAKLEIL